MTMLTAIKPVTDHIPAAPGLKVLLVDDDPAILRIVAVLLRKSGHQVTTAANGREALHKISLECPHMLITDWNMPEMDGLELIREVRNAKLPGYIYTLLLTARSSAQELAQGIEAGANDFISKPVTEVELVARIHAGQRIIELERNLRLLSESDGLTGVMNRRTFHNQIVREWARAKRYEQPLAVVIMDVDYFKRVNDDHGHAAGDSVLMSVAGLLRDSCRPSDYVCRYGGEEFVVLLPQTDEMGAVAWTERTRKSLEELVILTGDKTLHVTASFGVAERLADTKDPEQLVDMADQCLLVAKRTGRNRVVRNSQLHDLAADPFGNQNGKRHPLEGVQARDVMSTLVMTLQATDSILHAVELVLQMRLPSVPVVDADGNIAGIISEKDLMLLDVAGEGWNKTVGDVMKTNVVVYDETHSAKEIFDFLCRVSIRRVVVVSNGQPVGMLSRDTYLRWYTNWIITQRPDTMGAQLGGENPQQQLTKTARTLANSSQILLRQLEESESLGEVIPCIIGGSTRIQDLATDLLGHCQQAFAM